MNHSNKTLTIFLSLIFIILNFGCTPSQDTEEVVIQYESVSITKEDFLKSFLKEGFILYGADLISRLQEEEQFKRLQMQTLQNLIEGIFINKLANKNDIIVKDSELNSWIQERTQGVTDEDLKYFLELANLSLKEWKMLFKNQLLKVKVLDLYKESKKNSPSEETTTDESQMVKQYQIGTIVFDSKLEAQNTYKEIKAFPDRFEDLMFSKKGTKRKDWVTSDEKPLYDEIKNLRKNQISKPFESPWGHIVLKLYDVEKKPLTTSPEEIKKNTQLNSKYLQSLKEFKDSKELKLNLSPIYNMEIKK